MIIRASIKALHDQLKEARVGQFVFRSDESVESGGNGEAPQPMHYVVAGIGFGLLSQLTRFAPVLRVPINGVSLDTRGVFPIGSKYAVEEDGGVGIEELLYRLEITSDAEPDAVRSLATTAGRYCHGAEPVRGSAGLATDVYLNGADLAGGAEGGE